jgi:hypothetical protein
LLARAPRENHEFGKEKRKQLMLMIIASLSLTDHFTFV